MKPVALPCRKDAKRVDEPCRGDGGITAAGQRLQSFARSKGGRQEGDRLERKTPERKGQRRTAASR